MQLRDFLRTDFLDKQITDWVNKYFALVVLEKPGGAGTSSLLTVAWKLLEVLPKEVGTVIQKAKAHERVSAVAERLNTSKTGVIELAMVVSKEAQSLHGSGIADLQKRSMG